MEGRGEEKGKGFNVRKGLKVEGRMRGMGREGKGRKGEYIVECIGRILM